MHRRIRRTASAVGGRGTPAPLASCGTAPKSRTFLATTHPLLRNPSLLVVVCVAGTDAHRAGGVLVHRRPACTLSTRGRSRGDGPAVAGAGGIGLRVDRGPGDAALRPGRKGRCLPDG